MLQDMKKLDGVWHIALTPFLDDESVDIKGIGSIVSTVVDAGCKGIVPNAIMGEAHKLTEDERDEVLDAYVGSANGALHVVAGVTSESTVQAIDRARRAESIGATSLMMAPPRNCAVGPGLFEHYRRVCESVSIPMVVQDEPVTTGVKMHGEFFGELAKIDSVVSVKVEEAPSPPKVSAIRAAAPTLRLLGGLGGISLYEELKRGAVGIMTGFGFPDILADIVKKYLAGDTDGARQAFYHYLPLIRFEAQLGVGGVSIRKQLFYERGIIKTPLVRAPIGRLDSETVDELRELLDVLAVR